MFLDRGLVVRLTDDTCVTLETNGQEDLDIALKDRQRLTAMATRNIAPARALAASLPRVAMIAARESIARRVGGRPHRPRSR
jgi:hypothetical protein